MVADKQQRKHSFPCSRVLNLIFGVVNRFLVITTYAPASFEKGTLREAIFHAFYAMLKAQTYPHFQVLLFGHLEDKEDGNLRFVKVQGKNKGEKLREAFAYIREQNIEADYITRLDDDDWLSLTVMEQNAHATVDLIADEFHAFADVLSGKWTVQKRPWIANTAFHRFEHAMHVIDADNGTGLLFDYDHSEKWHAYYADKNIQYTSKNNPVYMRVLSPTTITSSGSKEVGKVLNAQEIQTYRNYCKKFGRFQQDTFPEAFLPGQKVLEEARKKFGLDQVKTSIWQKLFA